MTQAASVVVTEHGGSDVLRVQQREVRDPGPGELLVRVAAAGVNFIDVYQRSGVYPIPTPFVLGLEGAGEVVAAGPDTDVAPGTAVAWSDAPGSQAQYAIVPAERAVPVPDGVSVTDAAAVMLQGMTAQYLTAATYPVQPGDPVLVHAAAGGAGRLIVLLAKRRGGFVVATVGSAAKAEVATEAGADVVLRYDEIAPEDLAAAVREAAGGRGMAAVYDGVGRSTFDASLASLAPRGTLALFGGASGPVPPVDPMRLNTGGSLFLTRPTLAHYVAGRAELLERAGDVLSAVADGSLRLQIGGQYPLADAARAYDDLEGRRTTGKLLLVP